MTGILDKTSFTFKTDTRKENNFYAAEIDYGIDFYAPQTMLSPDGRRIMIAWLQAWESYITPKDHTWSGMMTMPRELVLKNNCLIQRPIKEYEEMIANCPAISGKISAYSLSSDYDKITCYNNSETILTFGNISYPQCELNVKFTLPKNTISESNISSKLSESAKGTYDDSEKLLITVYDDNECYVNFTLNISKMQLTFDRSHSINNGGAINNRSINVKQQDDGSLKFRFIFDTYSCETFINNGEKTFTNAYFLNQTVRKIKVQAKLKCGFEYKFIHFNDM